MGQPRVSFVIPLVRKYWEAIWILQFKISVINENQKLVLDTHNQAAIKKTWS